MAGGALGAQGVRITGRILIGGTPPRPAAGVWAVLHGVTRGGGGPVDSARTDATGRFTMRLARVDSTAIYVVNGWRAGIAYFSEPLQLTGRTTAEFPTLTVYDTASTGTPIVLAQRLISITRAHTDGTRDVLEIIRLQNRDAATRVTNDSTRPVWQGALPAAAIQWQVGESDVSAQTVVRRGDRVALLAPLAPGAEGKQISWGYVIPANVTTLPIPVDQETGEVDLLLEDTAAVVTSPGLAKLPVDTLEGRWFARYRTGPLAAGVVVAIEFPRGGFRPQRLLPWLIGLVVVAFAVALIVALRRKPAALAAGPAKH